MALPKEIQFFNDIIKSVRNGDLHPLYFVVGEEEYFKSELLKALEKQVVAGGMKDFNYDVLYGSEHTENQVLNACLALPMMSDKRLVIVHDIDQLSVSDPEAFIRYFQKPEQSTVAIFSAKKVDSRKKLFANLHKQAVTIKSDPLKDENYVISWIQHHFKTHNKTIAPDALQLFFEHIGQNLFELANHIEKIVIYKKEGSEITLQDIEDMTGISKEFSVFQMINDLLERNSQNAFRTLKILIEQGQEPIALIAALYARVSKQWQYMQLHHDRANENDISTAIKVNKFFLKDYRKVAAKFSMPQLERAIQAIFQADRQLKSSSTSPQLVLELALHKILQP